MTRNPARIEPLVMLLVKVWLHNPDMRLGQLVMNAAARGNHKSNDIFYVEDRVIRAGLKKMLEEDK